MGQSKRARLVLAAPLGAVALLGGAAAQAERAATSPAAGTGAIPVIPAPRAVGTEIGQIGAGMAVRSIDGKPLGTVERVLQDRDGRHTVVIELATSLGITGDTVTVTAAEAVSDGQTLTVGMTRDEFVEMAELQG
ncbi:PRC-barrel domain-containing protein [Frigidibacter sp. MR17.14]|uniref:PRC-barrel domain-containing protein n=1 Tax=Frigidibacter sp. MR17.14 TaxID=3126509 RepID=UPI003012D507